MEDIIESVAAARGGLILRGDLLAAGLSEPEVRRLVRNLVVLRHGAYARTVLPETAARHLLLARAAQATHPGSVAASHVTAALAWGLPLWRPVPEEIHVRWVGTIGSSGSGKRAGIRYFTPPACGSNVIDRQGLSTTPAGEVVLDCARLLPLDEAVAIGDAALHSEVADVGQMQRYAAQLTESSARGLAGIARMLDLVDPRSESPGETRLRLIAGRLGYRVVPQFEIAVNGRLLRADLWIEGTRALLEFDGRSKYGLNGDIAAAHWAEKQRRDALTGLGWEVIRVVWADLADEELVATKIRRGLAIAARR
ncbi:MAG: hypothetical protein ACOYEV_15400 [Candidatus Nanopelagicales bacterium]